MTEERLQKVLARGGVASRRAAEELITAGRVRVNGRVVTELGTRVHPRKDVVTLDGKRVVAEEPVYFVLHKPRGYVTTLRDPEGRPTVETLLGPIGVRAYPVGRLDFATSGVLIVTNDGHFAAGLMHPRRAVPKTYVLKVHGLMKEADLQAWRRGVELEDGKTLPARVKLLRHEGDKTWIEVTLTEGRNQQIRRMGKATGFPVMRLARIAFAGVTAEGLRPGALRPLSRSELSEIKKTYGVPKRIPSEPGGRSAENVRSSRARPATPRTGSSGREGTGRRAEADGRRGASERAAPHRPTEGVRYGGGAPVRRGYDVGEDWGGGVRRGRSDFPPPDESVRTLERSGRDDLGRGLRAGGQPRTTGTGGGPGRGALDDPSYRISRTRRSRNK